MSVILLLLIVFLIGLIVCFFFIAKKRKSKILEFTYNGTPWFKINYQSNMKIKLNDNYLFNTEAGLGAPNIIVKKSIVNVSDSMKTKEIGEALWKEFKKNQNISQGSLIKSEEIKMTDGTPGCMIYVNWKHPKFNIGLTSILIRVQFGDTPLIVTGTDMNIGGGISDVHLKYLKSLRASADK